jgi:hypothetical protein
MSSASQLPVAHQTSATTSAASHRLFPVGLHLEVDVPAVPENDHLPSERYNWLLRE